MVERYSMSVQGPFDRDPPGLEPDNDGDWVLHSDYTTLERQIAELRAEVAEHKRLKNQLVLKAYPAMDAIDEIDRLTAELAEARKVIEPFVWGDPAIEQILFGDQPDTASVTFTIPFGAIRAARSFLASKGE